MKEHPFIKTIKEIVDHMETKIAAPPITFEYSIQAASEYWEMIRSAGGLDNLIRNSPFSSISYAITSRPPFVATIQKHIGEWKSIPFNGPTTRRGEDTGF
jgi:hypothetical protein